jgi:hypothetical protein
MRKVGMSVSLSIKTIVRVDDYIKEHGGNFSGFIDIAAAYYLDHNQNVTEVSINDSEMDERPPEVTPKPKNDFNFDDMNIDTK